MDAQVRTIVALTGERLVVLPEQDYQALLQQAAPKAIQPAQMAAPKAVLHKQVSAPKAVGAPATATKAVGRRSLEDVLIFG